MLLKVINLPMELTNDTMKAKLAELMALFLVGGVGGTAHYIQHWLKDGKFSWTIFLGNIAIAGFVGILAGQTIPVTSPMHDAGIAIAGFLATQILEALDKKGTRIAESLLKVRIEEMVDDGIKKEAVLHVETVQHATLPPEEVKPNEPAKPV